MVQIAQSIAKDTMIVLMVIMPAVLVEGRYVWLVILILATTALKVSAHAFLIICIYLSFSFSSFFSSVSPINFVFNILLCFSSLLSLFFYFHLSPSLSLSLSLSLIPCCFSPIPISLKGIIVCREGCHPVGGYCTVSNQCSCNNGWTGTNCNISTNCPSCTNGVCYEPNVCTCNHGWTGSGCSTPVCDPACNRRGGYCYSPNNCSCYENWSGRLCDIPPSQPGILLIIIIIVRVVITQKV